MTVVADAASTGLAHEVNMDVNAATGTVGDCEMFVDTVENVACMETDKTVTDTTPDATHCFHKAGPEVSAQQTKK